ncbi:Tab2/Atab2 family RNA-binding protein [Nodosilinea sp. E11]|uniref:Tab2/Atab2 family RNA-binding protein n=1 Tax=Nodosilinea sp. E11 TaxID=3037479 RepID=UPI002934EE6D|nr:Tab2/Atab2 family RNA-binding protein [Nodosilinea sp. E11]WOD38935.1 Tab2/Atab2 family RNA-binding protein [Nodosilinea sp. E11]
MTIWQADLHRPPLVSDSGEPLWEILLCSEDFSFSYGATAPQAAVNKVWVREQVSIALAKAPAPPEKIQVFRPQALSLLTIACEPLAIAVEPTRHTPTLHQWLQQRARWYPSQPNAISIPYNPLHIESPPPVPLPENLWGDRWGFTAIAAYDFEQTLPHEPIPLRHLPTALMPSRLGLASTTPIPGIVVDAGRQAMALAQWVQANHPAWLTYERGAPDGLILAASLCDRWVFTTFSDPDVASAGQRFEQRQRQSQGLHFLLVRPDDSGMTTTGLWLLQQPLPG